MNLALISPTKYLSEFTNVSNNNNYYMVLAHRYYKDKNYKGFYEGLSKNPENFVILDNGACELKASIDGRKLFGIASELKDRKSVV